MTRLVDLAGAVVAVRAVADPATRALVVVGGCSRAGKSTFARHLAAELNGWGIPALIVSADSWIIDVRARPDRSTVFERFDCRAFEQAVLDLLAGRQVTPPVYDSATRSRLPEPGGLLSLPQGMLIAEGVVALGLPALRRRAALKIYVDVTPAERLQRLFVFYTRLKGFDEESAARLIAEREEEEVTAISRTEQSADLTYRSPAIAESGPDEATACEP